MTTTPNGVPIISCDKCGHTHPITRKHCRECGRPSLFIRPKDGRCIHCHKREATQ